MQAGLRRDFPLLFAVPALLAGQLTGSLTWVWAVPGALVLVLMSRKGSALRVSAAALAVGILSAALRQPPALSALPSERETVLAVIEGAPRRARVGEIRFRAVATRNAAANEPFRIFCTAVDLPWRNATKLQNGSTILLRAAFKLIPAGGSPFTFAATLRRDGIQARCAAGALGIVASPGVPLRERLVAAVREDVEAVLGPGERAGLILSMGLGVRDVLSERTEAAFKAAGLAHLLVVSGYQVTLVFGSAYVLLLAVVQLSRRGAAISWNREAAGWAAFAISLGFIYFVGIEGSTLRAGLALLCCLIVRHTERRGGMVNGILASLAVISVLWPGSAFEPGVELTYAALGGIALGTRERRSLLASISSVTFYATTATALVSLVWFGTLSLAGFLLNPILAPALGVISCEGGFVAIVLHATGIDGPGFGLRLVSWALEAGRDLVVGASEIPFASVKPEGYGFQAALAVLGLTLLTRFIHKFNQYVTASGLDFRATETGRRASNLTGRLTLSECAP